MQTKEIVRLQLPPIDRSTGDSDLSDPLDCPFAALPLPPLGSPAAPFEPVKSEPAKSEPVKSDRHWLPQSGVAISAALTLTSGAVMLSQTTAAYEGQFALHIDTATPQTAQSNPVAVPAVPQIDPATVSRILESPKLLNPVVDRLQAENRSLDYETLRRNLTVEVQPDRVEVRYRDQDPDRLQAVLQTLAQTYMQYSQDCRQPQCRGLNYIELRLPEIQQQVDRLRTEMQQFQQQHDLSNLNLQVRLFSSRSTEVAKQQGLVQQSLIDAQNYYASLQQRLGMKSEDPIAGRLLFQDPRYLPLLNQLRQVDRQIAAELTRLDASADRMRSLNEKYQGLQTQLGQIAQQVLPAYLRNPRANLQDPMLQTPETLAMLQQAIGTMHYLQMLQVRQETIDLAQQQISARRQELAAILRRHDQLQQEYASQIAILQQYLDQQEQLKAAPQPQQAWTLIAPPEIVHRPLKDMGRSITWQEAAGVLALGATAVGLGIAAERSKQQDSRRWQQPLAISAEVS